jgi:hypothetical protein
VLEIGSVSNRLHYRNREQNNKCLELQICEIIQHILILLFTDSFVLALFSLINSNFTQQTEWCRMILGRNFSKKVLFIVEENKGFFVLKH